MEDNYVIAKLSDIFDLQMGKTPSRNNEEFWKNGTNKWVAISDFNEAGKYITDTKEHITNIAVDKTGIKLVPKGTVIMSFKLSLGKVAITAENMYTNEAIMALLDKRKYKILTDYLYYCLLGLDWHVGANKAVMGMTLNKKTLGEKKIKIPTIDVQQRIVRNLDEIMNIDMKLHEQQNTLDTLIKSRFVEMFGDPVTNPKNWKADVLKNLTSKIGSGATPKGGQSSYIDEGVSLVRSMNVHDGEFIYKDLAHINEQQAKELDNVTLQESDVLLNITGASVTRTCIVPSDVLPARVNQHVSIVRCNGELSSIFLNQQFLSDSYKRKLWSVAEAGGATRQAITKQQIESLKVIVPPIELQNQFANFVQQVDQAKQSVSASIETLQTLKASLMQKYFH